MSDRQDSVPGEAEMAPPAETGQPATPVEAAAATIEAAVADLKREPFGNEAAKAEPTVEKAEPQGDLFGAERADRGAGEARIAPLITIAAADSATGSPPKEKSRSGRFALLAASVALAGAIGAMVGTLGATGLSLVAPGVTGSLASSHTDLAQVKSELAALKASIERANRNSGAQFARIGTRIDRIEHSAAEPAAKLAKAIDAINRLERRSAVAAAGTVSAKAAAAEPAAKPASTSASTGPVAARAAPDITGSIPLPRPKAARPAATREAPVAVVRGWRVRDVFDGMALIQGRLGVIEVAPGDILPGLGEIRAVERQRGQWVVVTSRGVITSH